MQLKQVTLSYMTTKKEQSKKPYQERFAVMMPALLTSP